MANHDMSTTTQLPLRMPARRRPGSGHPGEFRLDHPAGHLAPTKLEMLTGGEQSQNGDHHRRVLV